MYQDNKYLIETSRLSIRLWRESDLPEFTTMCADPKVMEFFPQVLSKEDSAAHFQRMQQHQAQHGFGIWVAEEKSTGAFVGSIGFAVPTFEEWFTPCVEIGWRFNKDFWNRGLCTEAALACLDYGFSALGFKEIFSFTSLLNLASERVMQKIGMTRVGEFDHPRLEVGDRLRRHVVYRIKSPL